MPEGAPRTAWIIDGGYLYAYGRGRPFDYLKLKREVEALNGGPIAESYYLSSVPTQAREAQNGFHNWLKSAAPMGPQFRVQLYELKDMNCICPACGEGFGRPVQRGVDVAIATLMLKLTTQNRCERLILASGDGDLEDAVAHIKSDLRQALWLLGSQATLSPDLQCHADRVLWLDDMAERIARN